MQGRSYGWVVRTATVLALLLIVGYFLAYEKWRLQVVIVPLDWVVHPVSGTIAIRDPDLSGSPPKVVYPPPLSGFFTPAVTLRRWNNGLVGRTTEDAIPAWRVSGELQD